MRYALLMFNILGYSCEKGFRNEVELGVSHVIEVLKLPPDFWAKLFDGGRLCN